MNKKKNVKLGDIFFSMVKIGCIGFGGGNALIPVIQKVVVDEKHMIAQSEYEEDVVVASITPGALPVEIASGIGRRLFGWKGLLAGSIGMALPGVFLTVLLLSVFSSLNETLLLQVEFVTVGITAFIACLLTDYIVGTVKRAKSEKQRLLYYLMLIGVFVLTCGKNLYRILEVDVSTFFGLSAIHVFAMAFFVILFVGGKPKPFSCVVSGCVCILYILCVGKNQWIQDKTFHYPVYLAMVVLALWGIKNQFANSTKHKGGGLKETGKEFVVLALFLVFSCVLAMVGMKHASAYIGNGFLSSVMSFGGGDAYLTVAEGMFVSTGFITENAFYGELVPLVNILPGSILCKTLSGVGFCAAYSQTGNIWVGYLVAFAGFICSIVASCGVFALGGCLYKHFEGLEVFELIKCWIRPIVSGLMLTVILALVYQNRKVGIAQSMGWSPVIIMVLIYGMNLVWYYKKKWSNAAMIGFSVVTAFVLCNFIVR